MAWAFAILFLVEAALLAMNGTTTLSTRDPVTTAIAYATIGLGLAYPVFALVATAYPRTPLFGVPCPTDLVTFGFLTLAPTHWWGLAAIPIVWATIAMAAAWWFGIDVDFTLPIAAMVSVAIHRLRRRITA